MQKSKFVFCFLLSFALVAVTGVAPSHADSPTPTLPLGEPAVKPMEEMRSYFGAVPLSDNRILIVGGYGDRNSDGPLASTEIYDIAQNRFIPATPTHYGYVAPTLLPLDDGRIFAVGFLNWQDEQRPEAYSPEIYDPERNVWTLVEEISLDSDELLYAARQDDGSILLMAYDRRAPEKSTRADMEMFRAWVYEPARESVRTLAPPFTPRTNFDPILLPGGEILATEGYTSVFEPEYRCEEIPAEYAIAAGEPSGDWCIGHGQWTRFPATTTELWNIHSGELERIEQTPISGRDGASSAPPGLSFQVLENGDVLVVRRISNRQMMQGNNLVKHAAVWSSAEKRWHEIPDFPLAYHVDVNNSLQEREAGILIGPAGKYSFETTAWEPLEGTGGSGVMVRMPSDRIGLLRMQELYWSELDAEPGTLRKDYVEVNYATPVGLDDGRLLVVGGISGFNGYELFAQVWDPGSNLWQVLELSNKTQMPERQLVRLGSGNVLLTGLTRDGNVICQRWQVRENRWSNCGAINLKRLRNESGMRNSFSVEFRYELGVLDDGRALLVDGPDSAYLYDEARNRWTRSIRLNHNDVPLVDGSPIELPPIYWFTDPETGAEIEVSHIVFSFRRRSPAHQGVGKKVTLWDPVKQHWAYIGNKLPEKNFFLPDGCTIGMHHGKFFLFNPSTREIHELPAPELYGRVAVTGDGIVAVVGEPQDGKGFFTRSVSCRGFAGEEVVAAMPEQAPVQPAATGDPAESATKESVIDRAMHYLDRYRWVLVAVIVPLVLFFLLRGIMRKLAAHDITLPAMPNTSWVVRILFYAAVGLLFGPLIISQLIRMLTTPEDDYADVRDETRHYWFEDEPQVARMRDRLSTPCHYVGVWQAMNLSPDEDARFRYTFNDDGTLEVHATEGRTATALIRGGYWAVDGWNMLWFDAEREDALANNFIVDEASRGFTIRQPDGQYTSARLVAPFHRYNCTE